MSGLFTLKLPKNYLGIDGSVKAEPSSLFTQVVRLDENAMIIDTRPQGNPMLSVMALLGLIGIYFMACFFIFGINEIFFPKATNEPDMGVVFHLFTWFGTVIFLAGIILLSILFYITVILPSPSSLLLDRKSRKVYGSFRRGAFGMDWNRVKPAIISATMVNQGGVMTLYHLWLAEFAEGKEALPESAENILSLSSGNVGIVPCVALWEFIRIYMNEAPENLPPTDVLPNTQDWTHRWLERGPYGGFHVGQKITTYLREHDGIPPFDFWISVTVFFFAPGMLFSLYDAWLRPQTRLKPEWIPAQPTSPNPYAITVPDNSDRPLREKAAKLVILWVATLMVSGCAFWWWLISVLVNA